MCRFGSGFFGGMEGVFGGGWEGVFWLVGFGGWGLVGLVSCVVDWGEGDGEGSGMFEEMGW